MMNKEAIKNMFGQIETPEANQTDEIINKINQGYKIKTRLSRPKRLAIIIASIMTMIILMGAALEFYVIRVFNEDGSSYLQYRSFRRRTYSDAELEQFEWRNEFFDYENADNILGIVYGGDGSVGGMNVDRTINDYDEFMELIKSADRDIFKLPQYIPDGYKFYNAHIMFYIDEDFDYENAVPIDRAEKFGNIYEKYYIPENPENIEHISVSYIKEEVGNSIHYNIWLHEPQAVNTSISGAENSQLEILQMPQFYRSSIMSTDYTENGKSWTMYSFSGINTFPVKRYLRMQAFSKEYREEYGNYSFTGELGSAHYGIGSNYGIGEEFAPFRDEIIKMAESIK